MFSALFDQGDKSTIAFYISSLEKEINLSNYIQLNHSMEEAVKEIIKDAHEYLKNVSDTYTKSRYDDISLDSIKLLFKLCKDSRLVVAKTIDNALSLNNERHILPDKDSDILIYDNNQNLIGVIHFNRKKL